ASTRIPRAPPSASRWAACPPSCWRPSWCGPCRSEPFARWCSSSLSTPRSACSGRRGPTPPEASPHSRAAQSLRAPLHPDEVLSQLFDERLEFGVVSPRGDPAQGTRDRTPQPIEALALELRHVAQAVAACESVGQVGRAHADRRGGRRVGREESCSHVLEILLQAGRPMHPEARHHLCLPPYLPVGRAGPTAVER